MGAFKTQKNMQFTEINGLVYHYQLLENEAKPNLVFINSLGTDFRIWDEVVESLQADYQILRFDKPGHGLSEKLVSIEQKIEDYAQDLKALLDFVGWEKTSVIGISIGGLIAQAFALNFPKSLEKLVLSNTSAKIGNDALWDERINDIQQKGLTPIALGIIQRWFSASYLEKDTSINRFYQQMILSTRVEGYLAACHALKFADFREKIINIQAHTLSIMGEDDKATPPVSQEIFNKIPNVKQVLIEKSGHLPCIEKPKEYASILKEFLEN